MNTSTASLILGLNAAFDVANSGFWDIYDGTKPATVATAISTQVRCAHFAAGATAFGAAVASGANATKTAGTIAASTATNTTATGVTWGTLTKSDGTRICDFSVTVTGGGGDITFDNIFFQAGAAVTLASPVISQAA